MPAPRVGGDVLSAGQEVQLGAQADMQERSVTVSGQKEEGEDYPEEHSCVGDALRKGF